MYTAGIRKIFESKNHLDRDVFLKLADKSGYKLATFNGQIWARISENNWHLTVLLLTDFEIKLN